MIFPGVRLFPDVAAGEPLYGFTVLEPFGSSIIEHDKRIENRPKVPPARLQTGAFWIAIHTGSRLYPDLTREDFRRLFRDRVTGERRPLWEGCPPFAAFNLRHVIGAARVIGCAHGHHTSTIVERDRWAVEGQTHWLLDPTVIRLPVPVAWNKGELGLWCPSGRPPASKATDPAAIREAQTRRAQFLALAVALRAARDNPANHRHALAAWHPRQG